MKEKQHPYLVATYIALAELSLGMASCWQEWFVGQLVANKIAIPRLDLNMTFGLAVYFAWQLMVDMIKLGLLYLE